MSQLQSVIDYTQKNTKLSGDLKRHLKKDFLLMLKSQENHRKIDMKKCRRSEQTWWLLQWVVIYFESQMLSSSYFFPTHDQFFHHHVCCFVAEMNVRKRGSEKIHTCLQPDIATNVVEASRLGYNFLSFPGLNFMINKANLSFYNVLW